LRIEAWYAAPELDRPIIVRPSNHALPTRSRRPGSLTGRQVGKYILRNYLRSPLDADFDDE
jgi:hypothetical protein